MLFICTLEHCDEEVEEDEVAHDEVDGVQQRQEHVDHIVDAGGGGGGAAGAGRFNTIL